MLLKLPLVSVSKTFGIDLYRNSDVKSLDGLARTYIAQLVGCAHNIVVEQVGGKYDIEKFGCRILD